MPYIGIPKSKLSRRIALLEERLGVTLQLEASELVVKVLGTRC
ncbi:MAG: hypothetical protein V4495_05220 [Pseudomonadota bacterium]